MNLIPILALLLGSLHPAPKADLSIALQSGSSGHSVTLNWTASTSAAGCVSPCTFGYNVFRGTAAGTENFVQPLNGSTPITALTYKDSTVTLGTNPVSYFYVIQAVETSSGVTTVSAYSNEVSGTFPGLPAAPVLSSPSLN